MKKDYKRVKLSMIKKAIVDYGMIKDGDKVAIGLSGGKDSSVLLNSLCEIRRSAPVKFDLHAIYIDLGWDMPINILREFSESRQVPFYYKPSDIGEIVFNVRTEKNPCALCANLRRGALNSTALEMGCNKVALGHHLDDVVETFFMSLFYTGQFRTFSPKTYLDRSNITMIRPMVYLKQEEIRELARLDNMPVLENPCPVSGKTKREEVKKVVAGLSLAYPDLRERFLNALQGADLKNLWPHKDKKEIYT